MNEVRNYSIESFERWIKERYPQKSYETEAYAELSFFVDLQIVFRDPTEFKASAFFEYPIDLILTYLRHTHVFYQNSYLSEIELAIDKLPEDHHKLSVLKPRLRMFFEKLKENLNLHIGQEEKLLFPYMDALVSASNTGKLNYSAFDKLQLIDFLMSHDDDIEQGLSELVKRLKVMTKEHDESFAFRMLLSKLSLFELDLKIHGWIEEEVLVPKAIEMEKQVLA